MIQRRFVDPIAAWLGRWQTILPLLVAEFVVWLGFGALLPVMPLYFTEHGVSLATLGVVVAAWPAARLVGEPIFGWVADRVPRVPLMVVGNVGAGVFQFLPLVVVGPGPFIVLRALSGLSTSMYDPAARGFIADATPADRRGEAFGLYGAAQMGGLLFGPAIGGLGSAWFGGIAFIFWFGALASFAAAAAIAWRVRETDQAGRHHPIPTVDLTEFRAEAAGVHSRAARDALAEADGRADPAPGPSPGAGPTTTPTSLRNRLLIAAIVFNLGGNFAAGTYEVVWSLFLDRLGAGLDLIGLTFALFGLPVLLLSPWFGRRVDQGGVVWFLVIGGVLPTVTGLWYTVIGDPVHAVPLILLESSGFAALNPALYAIVAAGSPAGRSSTAQGLYGAAGTIGFVVASLIAGVLAEIDIRLPFWVFAAVMALATVGSLTIGGRRLLRRPIGGPATSAVAPVPGPATGQASG